MPESQRKTTRRRRLYLALGGILVLKHWLLGDYGPIDRLLEVTIVVLILFEIVLEILCRRKEAKRRHFIDHQMTALMRLATRGEHLRGAVPNTSTSNEHLATRNNSNWIQQVENWIKEADSALGVLSSQASAEFMALPDADHVSVYSGNHPHGFYVREPAAAIYRALTIHIENLRRIIRTPEAYF